MNPVPVELSDEDRQFAEEHNLDLESLLANAINRERRSYEYENPPTAELTDSASDLITTVHHAALDDEVYSGQQKLTPRRLAVNARPHDGQYTLRIHAGEVNRLNGAEINETMRESGSFLADVSRNVRELLAELNGTEADEFVFELEDHNVDEYSGLESAVFELVVDPTEFEEVHSS